MGAPPDLAGFVESPWLPAVPYGPDSRQIPDFFRTSWKIQNPIRPVREALEHVTQRWTEMSSRLAFRAEGADLLFKGAPYQEAASNVADYYDIPLAAWHHIPMRADGHLISIVPSPLIRSAMTASDWMQWRITKQADDAQRREMGLPKATCPASRRVMNRGALEIHAYDALCFPGLAAKWGGGGRLSGR